MSGIPYFCLVNAMNAAAPDGAMSKFTLLNSLRLSPRRINYWKNLYGYLPSETPTRRPSDPLQGVGNIATNS